ncbi:MAG: 23S rRNA (adenine(2503)-C(2))-methyltransferase RlmN [Deltaproteobacteria bacterium]|nr:23S rRNA (adenine(2503)-C(2))-methyltransferase RlmN [Deltaproteobacteria bacterium]
MSTPSPLEAPSNDAPRGSLDVPVPGAGKVAKLLRDAQGRIDLKSLDFPALQTWVRDELGEKPFRARQLWKWMWQKGARTFDEMTDLARPLRERLQEKAFLPFLIPDLILKSDDGTMKFLWRLEDGHVIESVLIPDDGRLTLCVSSQVGCAMACTFCLTGDLGLKRHLKASEIANQALQIGRQLPEGTRITNLVLMGMGEPLHNLAQLVPALKICLDDDALNFSHRKITVSTVGVVPKMAELAAALPVNLAVSLNATTDEQRRSIMPITKKYSLAELLEACRNFPMPKHKRITFEYVMLAGINDSLDDADRLVKLLKGIPAKVNLIPYNENPDRPLKRPTDAVVKAFQHALLQKGMNTSVRQTRGLDISAACGQLGKARQQAVDQGWLDDARRIAGLV